MIPQLSKRRIFGIAVAGPNDAARGVFDIVLTEPGLSVIISAVLTSRAIFQRMKNYTVSQNFHKVLHRDTNSNLDIVFLCRFMQFQTRYILW